MKLKKIIGVLMAACMTMTCCACGGSQASPEGETAVQEETTSEEKELPVLRAAVMPFLNSVPVNYIADNGLDEKYGFDLEIIQFTTGGTMNEAIASDEWDVAVMSTASVYSLATYGAYLIADFADSAGGTGLYVRPDSPIAKAVGYNPTYPDIMGSPVTVRGKQVIFQNGHVSQLTTLKWLEKIGVNPEEIDSVNMEQSSAYQAFLAGEGDVAALAPPFNYRAEDEGWICVADLNSLDVPQRESVIATASAYEGKHDLLVAFLKALFEANEILRADPEMEMELLAEWYAVNGSETDDETIRKEVETRPFLTAEEACSEELGASTRMNAEFFAEIGTLEVDKLSVYDTNIVTDVLAEAIGYGE